jgi:hypothetical protein
LGIDGTTVIRYLRKLKIDIRQSGAYSYISIVWLERVMEKEGIFIQHALNGGEYIIPGTRIRADGFCAETNTIYEFYGDLWHGNPNKSTPEKEHPFNHKPMEELYQNTINRENILKNLGYNLVTMWGKDFIQMGDSHQ